MVTHINSTFNKNASKKLIFVNLQKYVVLKRIYLFCNNLTKILSVTTVAVTIKAARISVSNKILSNLSDFMIYSANVYLLLTFQMLLLNKVKMIMLSN